MSNIIKFPSPSSTVGAPLTAAAPLTAPTRPAKRSMLRRVVDGIFATVVLIFAFIILLLATPLYWLLCLATFVCFVVMVFNFTLTTVAYFALCFGTLVGLGWLVSSRK
jgi:uncharacterized protein (DUF983 family)